MFFRKSYSSAGTAAFKPRVPRLKPCFGDLLMNVFGDISLHKISDITSNYRKLLLIRVLFGVTAPVDQDLLIREVSKSHTTTHHSR